MRRTTLLALAFALAALAGRAQAQPAPLSEREQAWAERVRGALAPRDPGHVGPAGPGSSRVERVLLPSGRAAADRAAPSAPRERGARGLRLTLVGSDVQVLRLRLADPAAARELADAFEVDPARPVAVEVRGEQVVHIVGEQVRDPAWTRDALAVAWEVLPRAGSEPERTFVRLGPGELVLAERDGAIPTDGVFGGAAPGIRVGADRRGSWSVRGAAARLAELERYVFVLTGRAPAAPAARAAGGLSDVLNGAFGR